MSVTKIANGLAAVFLSTTFGCTLGFFGCHFFSKVDPLAGAIFIGSAMLTNLIVKAIFKGISENTSTSECTRLIGTACEFIIPVFSSVSLTRSAGYDLCLNSTPAGFNPPFFVAFCLTIAVGSLIVTILQNSNELSGSARMVKT
jgi:hypothetical protein